MYLVDARLEDCIHSLRVSRTLLMPVPTNMVVVCVCACMCYLADACLDEHDRSNGSDDGDEHAEETHGHLQSIVCVPAMKLMNTE